VAAGIITPRIAEEELRARSGTNAHFTEQAGSSWFENNLYPILNSHGAVIRIAVYSHDITSMKEWEQKMEEVNAQLLSERQEILKFSTIVENMDDSVIITDGTGIIQYVNTAFRKKFGFAPEEIQGKHFNEIQAPDNRFPVSREVFIGSSKDVWNGSFIAKNKFGIKLNAGLKSTPIIKDRNTVNRVFVLREQI
jgi:PAS domain S-box-containing protein